MPELDRVPILPGQLLQKMIEALEVFGVKVRWQLPQNRTALLLEEPGTVEEFLDCRRTNLQSLDVRNNPAALHCENEVFGRAPIPALDHALQRKPVKGGVDGQSPKS